MSESDEAAVEAADHLMSYWASMRDGSALTTSDIVHIITDAYAEQREDARKDRWAAKCAESSVDLVYEINAGLGRELAAEREVREKLTIAVKSLLSEWTNATVRGAKSALAEAEKLEDADVNKLQETS